MAQETFSTDEERLLKALDWMKGALQLLDDANAPADVGAHLDGAICRLKNVLAESRAHTEAARPRLSQVRK